MATTPIVVPPGLLPTLWDATSLGSTSTPEGEEAKPDDPLSAWGDFWRQIGQTVPEHVNRTRRIRGAIRRLGLE